MLDENLPAGQRQWLRRWRIKYRVVGIEIAPAGTQDEQLVSVLHHLAEPTFFSLDRNFYRPDWRHATYCLVWLDVAENWAAEFIRRFLHHPRFRTQAKRLGTIARVHPGGILFWRLRASSPQSVTWPRP